MVSEQDKNLYMLSWQRPGGHPPITREQLDTIIAEGQLTGFENVSEITDFDDLFTGTNPYNEGLVAPLLHWNMQGVDDDMRRTFQGCPGIEHVKLYLPIAINFYKTFADCSNLKSVMLTLPKQSVLEAKGSTVNAYQCFAGAAIKDSIIINNMSHNMNVYQMFSNVDLRGVSVKLYGVHNSNSYLFPGAYLDNNLFIDGINEADSSSYKVNPYGMFEGAIFKDDLALNLPKIYGDYIQSYAFSGAKMKDCIVTIDTANVASFYNVLSGIAKGFEPKAVYLTINVDIVNNFYQVYSGNPRLNFDLEIDIPTERGFNAAGFLKNCTGFNSAVTFNGGKVGGSDPWSDGINLYQGLMGCTSFNHSLNINLNAAVSVDYLLADCINFNRPVSALSMTYVMSLNSMFRGCVSFNQPVTLLALMNVTNVASMMEGCERFNQVLTLGLDGRVVNASKLLKGCTLYNQGLPVGLTHIDNGESMFEGCARLNKPLDIDVTKATNLKNMFKGCTAFIQNISHWDVEHIPEKPEGFDENTNALWTDVMKPQWGKAPTREGN